MPDEYLTLYLAISAGETDLAKLDELTQRLMGELRDLGAASVEHPAQAGAGSGGAPSGAKGDPLTIGALLLVALPALLPNLVAFLQAWSLRGENRRVKIKTPAGVEVEFSPEKRLSQKELLELVNELSKVLPSTPPPAAKA